MILILILFANCLPRALPAGQLESEYGRGRGAGAGGEAHAAEERAQTAWIKQEAPIEVALALALRERA